MLPFLLKSEADKLCKCTQSFVITVPAQFNLRSVLGRCIGKKF